VNLDDLEKLAKDATPGPWDLIREDGDWEIGTDNSVVAIVVDWENAHKDAKFIRASNPQTILKLISELKYFRKKYGFNAYTMHMGKQAFDAIEEQKNLEKE